MTTFIATPWNYARRFSQQACLKSKVIIHSLISSNSNSLSCSRISPGNYPGTRTKPMVTESTKDYIVSILGRNFTYWPVDAYNGAFQYTLASHKSWIHCDATEWAGLVYLTPDAPANGGTRFYRHKASRLLERPTDADGMRLGLVLINRMEIFVINCVVRFTNGTALMDYLYKDSQKYDKWDQVRFITHSTAISDFPIFQIDEVGNVFNRLVLFRGFRFHQVSFFFQLIIA